MAAISIDPGRQVNSSRPGRHVLVLVLLLALAVGGAMVARTRPASIPTPETVPAWTRTITFDDHPTDGVLDFTIPQGSYDAFERGEMGYIVPSRIEMSVGDRVVVRNTDNRPHMIFYNFIPPESTVTIPFETAGIFTFSSGCAANPQANSFTTVVVEEPAAP